jgi:hypothetical protein
VHTYRAILMGTWSVGTLRGQRMVYSILLLPSRRFWPTTPLLQDTGHNRRIDRQISMFYLIATILSLSAHTLIQCTWRTMQCECQLLAWTATPPLLLEAVYCYYQQRYALFDLSLAPIAHAGTRAAHWMPQPADYSTMFDLIRMNPGAQLGSFLEATKAACIYDTITHSDFRGTILIPTEQALQAGLADLARVTGAQSVQEMLHYITLLCGTRSLTAMESRAIAGGLSADHQLPGVPKAK